MGDYIHSSGNPDSVLATVKARYGVTVAAIIEMKSVLEDTRVNVVGGLKVGIDIWEISILPFLLNNSEVWADIPKGAVEQLEDLQRMFYRFLFATPISTPSPALLWEAGGWTMHYRIIMRKLTFYHHIVSLEEDAVASRVARVADRAGYPGLVKEYKSLCDELQLPHPATMSALSWKRKVKHAVMNANRSYLLDQIERNYQKLDYETLK